MPGLGTCDMLDHPSYKREQGVFFTPKQQPLPTGERSSWTHDRKYEPIDFFESASHSVWKNKPYSA